MVGVVIDELLGHGHLTGLAQRRAGIQVARRTSGKALDAISRPMRCPAWKTCAVCQQSMVYW